MVGHGVRWISTMVLTAWALDALEKLAFLDADVPPLPGGLYTGNDRDRAPQPRNPPRRLTLEVGAMLKQPPS